MTPVGDVEAVVCDTKTPVSDLGTAVCDRKTPLCDKRASACEMGTTICDERKSTCYPKTSVCDIKAAFCQRKTHCDMKTSVCDTRKCARDTDTGVCDTKAAVFDVKTGVCDTRPGVCDTRQGVCDTRPGVCDTRPGVCDTRQGVCDTRPGVCDTRQGVWGVLLYLVLLASAVAGQTVSPEPGDNLTISVTQPEAPGDGTATCHTAAAVIGSLVAGVILGSVITFGVHILLRRRRQWMPPKDYQVTEARQYDVNRNNDDDIHVVPDQSSLHGHKKLERLVKRSHILPDDTDKTPAATTPLIPSISSRVRAGTSPPNPSTDPGSSSPNPSTDPRPSPSNASTESGSSVPDPINQPGSNILKPRTAMKTLQPVSTEDVTYANVGAVSDQSQPYDILDIIPEETEYEQFTSTDYEGILVESSTK